MAQKQLDPTLDPCFNALCLVIWDDVIVEHLLENDPQALLQVLKALDESGVWDGGLLDTYPELDPRLSYLFGRVSLRLGIPTDWRSK